MTKNTFFLLVDDDTDDIFLFSEVLTEIDPTITFNSSENAQQALSKLRTANHLPDIIFLDLNMPGMDGKECLAELKNDSKLKHIPVIIYTTSSLSKDIELTMQIGAIGFITKPDSLHELKNILHFIAGSIKHNTLAKALQTLSNNSNTFIIC